jgi:tetratricopeptide (TPR) repeat protein
MEFFNRGEMNAAEEWFLKAVVTYPKYARAWNNIGVIHIKANDQAGAIEAWKKAVESNDKFVPPFFNIGRAYLSNKQPTDAETYLRKGLALDPNNVDGLFLLVTATGMQGNWDETVQVARKIHGLDHKRYADVHRFAGAALMQLNQHQAALAEYELYLQEDPQSPHAAQVRNTMTQLQAELH